MYIAPGAEIPRHFQSKMSIIQAMDDLLGSCTYDKLTVTSICEKAEISRSLFYRNFKSKDEALKWYLDFAADQGVRRLGVDLDWIPSQIRTLSAWLDMRNLVSAAARQKGRNSLSRFSVRGRERFLTEACERQLGGAVPDDLRFQVHAYTYLECGMIMEWARDGFNRDSRDMARLLALVTPFELDKLLSLENMQ